MRLQRSLIAPVSLALLLAACGGGSPTAAPGGTTGPGAPTSGPAATTTGGGGGGGGSADACALATADEVEAATGYGDVVAQPIPDDQTDAVSACGYVSQGALPAATIMILDPENTNADPAGFLALPGSEEVAVSGARAVYAPAAGYLTFVVKNGRVASIQVTPSDGDFKGTAQKLVQKVADRL
jgi:hypothetical protein